MPSRKPRPVHQVPVEVVDLCREIVREFRALPNLLAGKEVWRYREPSGVVRKVLYERDRGICAECRRQCYSHRVWGLKYGLAWHADHILPVVSGGAELGYDNFQTLCEDCHSEKSADEACARAFYKREKEYAGLCAVVVEACGRLDLVSLAIHRQPLHIEQMLAQERNHSFRFYVYGDEWNHLLVRNGLPAIPREGLKF